MISAFVLLLHCEHTEEMSSSRRILYVFSTADNTKEMEYLMFQDNKDSMIVYKYESQIDNDRDLKFTFYPKTNILNFGSEAFEEIEGLEFSTDSLSEVIFKYYRAKSDATDVTDPIFFNKDYGVLALGNVLAPTIIFLPVTSDLKSAKKIYDRTISY